MMGKRLRCALASLALCIGLVTSAVVPAMAAEIEPYSTTDYVLKLYLKTKGDTYGTGWAAKDTTSSTYVFAQSFTGKPCRLYVDGRKKVGSTWKSENCTSGRYGTYAPISKKGQYEIHNLVKEWGYTQARVTAWANNNGATTILGVWSADCAGNYTDLN